MLLVSRVFVSTEVDSDLIKSFANTPTFCVNSYCHPERVRRKPICENGVFSPLFIASVSATFANNTGEVERATFQSAFRRVSECNSWL